MRFDPALLRELIVFGLPLMAAQLSSFVLHFSDRYYLRAYTTVEAVGLYALAYKVAMVLSMTVSGPFKSIWIPKAIEVARAEGGSSAGVLQQILRYYNLLLVTAALGLALSAPILVPLIAGLAYREAVGPVPVLVLAMVFFGYRSVTQIGALIDRESGRIAASSAIAAVGVLLLNWTLIPVFGIEGAALATLAGFALEFFVMTAIQSRAGDVLLPVRELLRPLAAAAAVYALVALLDTQVSAAGAVAARVAALVLFAILVWYGGMLTPPERSWLRAAVQHPRRVVALVRGSPR